MSALITDVSRIELLLRSYASLSATFGAIAIALLLLLLLQKEALRTFAGPRAQAWMRALNIAVVPLLMSFGLIIVVRFVTLLVRGLR